MRTARYATASLQRLKCEPGDGTCIPSTPVCEVFQTTSHMPHLHELIGCKFAGLLQGHEADGLGRVRLVCEGPLHILCVGMEIQQAWVGNGKDSQPPPAW